MIIFYHYPCMDGLTAAWILSQLYPHAELKPFVHGQPPEYLDLHPKQDIIFVDCAPPPDVFLSLVNEHRSVRILDHHAGMRVLYTEAALSFACHIEEVPLEGSSFILNDQRYSGAGLALEWAKRLNKVTSLQNLSVIPYVQDHDLWAFKLEGSQAVKAYLHVHVDIFDSLTTNFTKLRDFDAPKAISKGQTYLDLQEYLVKKMSFPELILPSNFFPGEQIEGILMAYSSVYISELGNALARQSSAGIGMVWHLTATGEVKVSLRSIEKDVARLARLFWGNGHERAAGFNLPMQDFYSRAFPAPPEG